MALQKGETFRQLDIMFYYILRQFEDGVLAGCSDCRDPSL